MSTADEAFDEPVIHATYLPFTEAQLLRHFARSRGGPARRRRNAI